MKNEIYSFVVRIWRETMDDDGNVTVWRGSIDDVRHGERSYFTSLDTIVPFICDQIGGTFEKAVSGSGGGQNQE